MIQPEDRDMKSGIMDRRRLRYDGIIGFIQKWTTPGTINLNVRSSTGTQNVDVKSWKLIVLMFCYGMIGVCGKHLYDYF